MAASLEMRSVLAAATGAAARRVCDYSIAFVSGRDGQIEAAVGAHRDPGRFGMVERMATAHLPELEDANSIVASVLKSGEPLLIPRVPQEQLEQMMAPGEQLELARALGFASAIVVPLAARGRTLGVLGLVRDGSSPPFGEEDLSLAGMLAARTGLALDNARLYEERDYVAETPGGACSLRTSHRSPGSRSAPGTSPPPKGPRSAATSTTSSKRRPIAGSP